MDDEETVGKPVAVEITKLGTVKLAVSVVAFYEDTE